ncbi:hypothetical protein CCACVL1_02118, partial [Corchorus capsularis]
AQIIIIIWKIPKDASCNDDTPW